MVMGRLVIEIMMMGLIRMMTLKWKSSSMIQFLILNLLGTMVRVRHQMVRIWKIFLGPITSRAAVRRWPLG
jgi:hypothetical protein